MYWYWNAAVKGESAQKSRDASVRGFAQSYSALRIDGQYRAYCSYNDLAVDLVVPLGAHSGVVSFSGVGSVSEEWTHARLGARETSRNSWAMRAEMLLV